MATPACKPEDLTSAPEAAPDALYDTAQIIRHRIDMALVASRIPA